ncbi:MFS transporter [Alkalilimnicola ehrlichii MLHE-1]|uniref:Lysosomal dipeptide transporter MFSD1 n=1 Tax=Alkalilimnicola ehrlichii (strain ATCC BAA-1101 / DSM 17681 / MLHE-1) TaxID=187272 RepID=Q0AC79_ALKEH|nr:MFS transporter [Alkalilimnicola ehrlichii]ABI55558.1 major facilitator superfamily MFS_1 [Alkalilimnicola ehrlichii MLHE-1]
MTAYDHRHFQQVRWTIYIILILAYMLVFFHRMAPGSVSGDLTEAFGTSAAALGSLAAMYYYIYTAMQIPSGVLADTLGSRWAVLAGSLVAGVGSILFGLADTFAMASVGRFLVGLGVSTVFVGLMKSNSVWFSERQYGSISGLTLLLGNAGAIAATGPLALVLDHYDWRTVFVALGVFSIVLAVATWLKVYNKPEDAGFPSVREMEGKTAHAARDQHWLKDLRAVFANRKLWPGAVYDFGITGSFFGFVGLWAVPLLRDLHELDRSAASLYPTLATVAFAIGCLVAGMYSDRVGRRRPVLIGGAVVYFAVCLGLWLLPWGPGPLAMALFVALGLSAGCFVVAYAHAKEVTAPALAGMGIAFVNTGLFLGAALFQPIFGWIMDLLLLAAGRSDYGVAEYQGGLVLLCAFAALALAASLLLHETHCRNIHVKHD